MYQISNLSKFIVSNFLCHLLCFAKVVLTSDLNEYEEVGRKFDCAGEAEMRVQLRDYQDERAQGHPA